MNYRAKLQSIVSDELPTPEQLNGLGQLRDQRVEGDLNDDLNQAEIEEMTKDLRLAAVLVPLVEHADEPSILLTRRADHLEKHSGQVSRYQFYAGDTRQAQGGKSGRSSRMALGTKCPRLG